jgi:hypothetical protein
MPTSYEIFTNRITDYLRPGEELFELILTLLNIPDQGVSKS